jgi:hypothetical protein
VRGAAAEDVHTTAVVPNAIADRHLPNI